MVHAVILAGGVGSRFWPFSREFEPKQFMQLVGNSSLLQATIKRLPSNIKKDNIYVVSNQAYFHELKNQLKNFNIPDKNIILEPEGKNTAPAIGLCAKIILEKDKDATLIVLPSDHHINQADKFKLCLKKAVWLAQKKFLVTIGIKPTSASTGYGYIKTKGLENGYLEVEKFLEKPDLANAKKYIKNKKFFWNSGIFIWKASVFLEEVKKYLPELSKDLNAIKGEKNLSTIWKRIKPISVDYGIMEHSKRIALIPANFYWSDLGSWDALNEIFPKDSQGNILQADSIDLNSQGICVFSRSNRLISTIGLKDIIIADTKDALLVCDRKKSQEVKKITDQLKLTNRKERLVHLTEKRPWGTFTVLEESHGFKIKVIEIAPHKRLSLQMHNRRAEHWVVVCGFVLVTINNKTKRVQSNESIFIPKKTKHRLENPTNQPVKIVEVQTGSYLEEDDIKRFDDDFSR